MNFIGMVECYDEGMKDIFPILKQNQQKIFYSLQKSFDNYEQ